MMTNLNNFEEKLMRSITLDLPAKDLARRVVAAVLENEYGRAFTTTPGFDKMVDTLADSLVTNPDLRRQMLAVAGIVAGKNK